MLAAGFNDLSRKALGDFDGLGEAPAFRHESRNVRAGAQVPSPLLGARLGRGWPLLQHLPDALVASPCSPECVPISNLDSPQETSSVSKRAAGAPPLRFGGVGVLTRINGMGRSEEAPHPTSPCHDPITALRPHRPEGSGSPVLRLQRLTREYLRGDVRVPSATSWLARP